MNNKNTQKAPGIVYKLLAMFAMGNVMAGRQAKELLVNGYRAPMPGKFRNQRQKRKLAAQTR